MNQREVYGKALVELGREDPRVVACEADLGGSTMSSMFQAAFPERYFEMGIAEQNMVSFAAGLSLTGKIPFVHSFAMFLTGRSYEQIRQSVCVGECNVKIIGSSYGLSDFGDGATHQVIEDISLMCGLPNMQVFTPVDGRELEGIMEKILDIQGPVYLRINRNDLPELGEGGEFQPGEPRLLREGGDGVIFAHGVMASRALEAAEILERRGLSIKVVNLPSLKPLNAEAIREHAKGTRGIIVAEEHSVYGGAVSLLASIFRGSGIPMEIVGIEDRFGLSADSYEGLLQHYGLSAGAIVTTMDEIIN